MVRNPVVAGTFYTIDALQLRQDLDNFTIRDCEKQPALGLVSPHAGYVYSGAVAGELYSKIKIPDTVIVLSPNHTGHGVPFSIWPGGYWRTPLGDVKVDEELVNELVNRCDLLEKDKEAHLYEHAAEVQLPFIQYFRPEVKIAVMVLSSDNIRDLKYIGVCLSEVIQKLCPNALVVASSDMTHHESQDSASRKDQIAINEILALDEDSLFQKVRDLHITMCGIYPAVVMLVCSKERGCRNAGLIRYATSGDVTGEYNQVVGYAGIIIN